MPVIQFTKILVIASTLVAALVELYLATRLTSLPAAAFALVAFGVAVAAGRRWGVRAASVILFASYVAPAVHLLLTGYEQFSLEVVWALPLLGVVISGREAWRWHLPIRWRWPLETWALVLACSWPIVFLRELDFYLPLLYLPGVSNTSIGITPWETDIAVSYWTFGPTLGLLWFDRLFGWYTSDAGQEFRRVVLLPMAAALAVACLVGAYQAFVDISFLNPHLWPHMRRASGTLGDANAYGVIAALWAPIAVMLARGLPQPWSIVAGAAGVGLAALGVLTSGSRTALAAMVMGLAAVLLESVLAWRRAEGRPLPRARQTVPLLIGALVLVVVAVMVFRGSVITSVVGRGSLGFVPGFGDLGIRESARQLWDRFGYGTAAVAMVWEHPWAGVGVGSFHTLVHDFGVVAGVGEIPPDNAQNWYRHLIAELGWLGSVPWIAWVVLFVATLLSKSTAARDRLSLGMVRGSLVAFGIISLLGMPGQSLPVILTFWTLAFCFLLLKGIDSPAAAPVNRSSRIGGLAIAAALIVVFHAGVTLLDAQGDLRPRNRAARFNWDYQYGIDKPDRTADGSPGRRWAERRSVSVIPVRGTVLKFVGWIDHPDGDENPVHVRVWADDRLVFDDDLKRSAAIYRDIPAVSGQTRMVIETEVSRTWDPREFGRNDNRVRAFSVRDWVWE